MNLSERIKRDPFGAAALAVMLFGLLLFLTLGRLGTNVNVTLAQPTPATSPQVVLAIQQADGATQRVLAKPEETTVTQPVDMAPAAMRPFIVAIIVPPHTTTPRSTVTRPAARRVTLTSPPTLLATTTPAVTTGAPATTTTRRPAVITVIIDPPPTTPAVTTTTDPPYLDGADVTTTTQAATTTSTSEVTTTSAPPDTSTTDTTAPVVTITLPPLDTVPMDPPTTESPSTSLVRQLVDVVTSIVSPPFYSTCANAQMAGDAPLLSAEPGFRPELDLNGDGIACELD